MMIVDAKVNHLYDSFQTKVFVSRSMTGKRTTVQPRCLSDYLSIGRKWYDSSQSGYFCGHRYECLIGIYGGVDRTFWIVI